MHSKYCQKNKGLVVFAYCLMHSHLHLFCRADGDLTLSEIMRDFKKYTSKKIIQTIQDEPESRREWLLEYFSKACEHLSRPQRNTKFGKMAIMQKKFSLTIG